MLTRALEDEDETFEDSGPSEPAEPEYSFDGFTVEFSDKVMLTPVVAVLKAQTLRAPRAESRGRART